MEKTEVKKIKIEKEFVIPNPNSDKDLKLTLITNF